MIKFIKNEAALRLNEFLIISDTHIGIENDYKKSGYEIPSQTQLMLKRIRKIKKQSKSLIILGDIKHSIPFTPEKEEEEVKLFINELRRMFKEVILIKGNHDAGIESIIDDVKKEYITNNIALIHGHTVSDKALEHKIIAGHMHPVYSYKNHLGIVQRRKCFIISDKIIVMPAFTDLSAGSDELAKPLRKHIINEEVILLDQTKVK